VRVQGNQTCRQGSLDVQGRQGHLTHRAVPATAAARAYAFQFILTDDELTASLAAIRAALREGGRFVFETRHPQARAWLDWNPSNGQDVTGPAGRPLRVWNEVESVAGDLVTFTGTTAQPDGAMLSFVRATLRFPGPETIGTFLAAAGFQVEAQYGDWDRTPITTASREIITIARTAGLRSSPHLARSYAEKPRCRPAGLSVGRGTVPPVPPGPRRSPLEGAR
jgi:hypothetical protein